MQSHSVAPSSTQTGHVQQAETRLSFSELPAYIVCGSIGLVGGALGVALALALAIIAQLALPPTAVIGPNAVLITALATLSGAGFSWGMARLGGYLLPRTLGSLTPRKLQLLMVMSVLTSLLEAGYFLP